MKLCLPRPRLTRRILSLIRPTACLLVSVLVFVSCARAEPPLFSGPPVLTVTLDEMSFGHSPNAPRGRVRMRMENVGRIDHRLVLAPLPEDFPPITQQLSGEERRPITPIAGIPDRAPGETGQFAVDLVPGRYALICFYVDPDGKSHADKGMASEFRVV